jgi:hypothetical protein
MLILDQRSANRARALDLAARVPGVRTADRLAPPLPYVYRSRSPAGRQGQRCRILARGRGPGPRNLLLEFADGCRVVSTWRSVRKEG